MSTLIEGTAVILGLAYLLLAIREHRACWLAGGLASLLFFFVFRNAQLPMQALLQIYYLAVAVHGWRHWGARDDRPAPAPHRLPWYVHVAAVAACFLATLISLTLRDGPHNAQAWLDSGTSWAGVLATWLVARKVLESWLYWILIDALSLLLYLRTGLLATAALYALYTALAYLGWREWLAHYRRESGPTAIA